MSMEQGPPPSSRGGTGEALEQGLSETFPVQVVSKDQQTLVLGVQGRAPGLKVGRLGSSSVSTLPRFGASPCPFWDPQVCNSQEEEMGPSVCNDLTIIIFCLNRLLGNFIFIPGSHLILPTS
jgi:hypothetical protein